jgi:hypothetical protein
LDVCCSKEISPCPQTCKDKYNTKYISIHLIALQPMNDWNSKSHHMVLALHLLTGALEVLHTLFRNEVALCNVRADNEKQETENSEIWSCNFPIGEMVKHHNKSARIYCYFCDFLRPVFIQQKRTSTSDVLLALRTLAR